MDKRSFYEILAKNVKANVKEESSKKINPYSIITSKLLILLMNVFVMWFSWNSINEVMKMPNLNFLQTLFLYLIVKILFRGLFS